MIYVAAPAFFPFTQMLIVHMPQWQEALSPHFVYMHLTQTESN